MVSSTPPHHANTHMSLATVAEQPLLDYEVFDQLPAAVRQRVLEDGIPALRSYHASWQSLGQLWLNARAAAGNDEETADRAIRSLNLQPGPVREWARALQYLNDPKYANAIGQARTPESIAARGRAWDANQLQLNPKTDHYDVTTTVSDLSFDSLTGDDVLKASPNIAGATGENAIRTILETLGIKFEEQYQRAFLCDFGEEKRPDFKVGTVKAKADARLARGFYIESAMRLSARDKDLGLYYLLHQIVQFADLPTIVVYDAPMISDRVAGWAARFSDKHRSGGKLFGVVTLQQFREWAIRKLGKQQ
jgi:hypothetical protein